VSIFLTTGFVDGDVVPWWDQLAEIVDRARPGVRAEWPDGPVCVTPSASRRRALRALEERAKAWRPDVRNEAFALLATAAGTAVPTQPRSDARPLTWDGARALERRGLVRFGPHSVSHPILRVLDDAYAAAEIRGSWERLQHELVAPLPVFCYPNGRFVDFGERDVRLVREAGCVGALTGEVGYANGASTDAYRIARVPLPAHVGDAARWATGFETYAARWRTRRQR
jgi:polysaccharide deacetylase